MTEYIVDANGCWLWQRAINNCGYGAVSRNGKKGQPAHRVYFEEAHGAIPAGAVIDHLCRVRRCVNPAHLEAVKQSENLRRGAGGKLTADDVRQIRRECADGVRQVTLARRFGVDPSHVSKIVSSARGVV